MPVPSSFDIGPCHHLVDHLAQNGGVWEVEGDTPWIHPHADMNSRLPPAQRYKFRMLWARQTTGFAVVQYAWWPFDDDDVRHKKVHSGRWECPTGTSALWTIGWYKLRGNVTQEPDGTVRAELFPYRTFGRPDKVVFEVPAVKAPRTVMGYFAYRPNAATRSLDDPPAAFAEDSSSSSAQPAHLPEGVAKPASAGNGETRAAPGTAGQNTMDRTTVLRHRERALAQECDISAWMMLRPHDIKTLKRAWRDRADDMDAKLARDLGLANLGL